MKASARNTPMVDGVQVASADGIGAGVSGCNAGRSECAVSRSAALWPRRRRLSSDHKAGGRPYPQPVEGVDAYDPVTQKWRQISVKVPLLAPILVWTGDAILAVGWTKTGEPRSVAASLCLETGD